ncbi:Glycerol-3-phosphate acyltransferase [Nitrincola lacisaponensis]|uniref:Glycerol-3-phosphate acyltransferase n=1 Tax=Nitrincola lacisaponensis TaxID=267850 RepID=A0A063Y304_9GAMM|nr:1-acyl-sn-glycerol-3-phosphate acyltransferase [Nitrincola lacisaponensis]KDE39520.1 Glycerol-3-phosphate acyltransferase [Nitrincola lacisaponensis]
MSITTSLYRLLLKHLIRKRVAGSGQLSHQPDTVYVLEKPFTADRLILENLLTTEHSHWQPEQITAIDNQHPDTLRHQVESLVALQRNEPDRTVRLQPVMVLAGHLPNSAQPLFLSALSESWANSGSLVRFTKLLLNCRSTLVRIDEPLRLSDLIQPGLSDSEIARRALWVLRTHFQRCRQAILGPDLSHRRTLMQQVLASPEVGQAITQTALKKGVSPLKLEQQVADALDSIVADFNPGTARVLNRLIQFMLNRLFSRINLQGLDQIQQLALTHNLVYLPCHRSHLDYILLSWLLYRHGLMVPHVVAGDNLNIPVVGAILRRGGAIFMRRSFRDDPLYALVFRQYLTLMLHRGHSIEYFIEGGRSRSGRLLSAKTGLLKMTLDAWQQSPSRPMAFIPVSISYDRMVEGRSYQRELSGGSKVRENLLGTLKSLRILFQRYGEVSIGFGQPVRLEQEASAAQIAGEHSASLLGQQVMERINQAFMPSAMSLIASLLLSAPQQQLREIELLERLEALKHWLSDEGIPLPPGNAQDWVIAAAERQQISRGQNAVAVSAEQAAELTFYRNMLMHQLILPGLVLLFYRRLASSGVSTQTRLLRALYPYIRAELSLTSPEQDQDLHQIRHIRERLSKQQLLATEGQPLQPLAEHLIRLAEPVLLRQYLLVRVMTALQQTTELELFDTTRALALHLHEEYGYAAPEYADRRVFEGMTEQLLLQGVLSGNPQRLLLARPLDQVLRVGEKLLPTSLIQRAEGWLKQQGISA